MSLNKLKQFFKNYEFTDKPVRLNHATVVVNQKKFVESMISLLEANTGNINYKPYYRHLLRFYLIVKKDKNGKKIFERDILNFDAHEWNRNSFKPQSEWKFPVWEVIYDTEHGAWSTGGGTNSECSSYKEVCGNTHENHELLKK